MMPTATLEATLGPVLQLGLGGVATIVATAFLFSLLWWPFAGAALTGAWVAFEKAGRPGWTSLLPVYNGLQFLRMAKSPGWWLALLFVPGVNVVVFAVTCDRLARAFGQRRRFTVGLVLLPPIFLAALGFGPARYRRFEVVSGSAPDPEQAHALAPAALAMGVPRLVPVR